MLYRGDKFVKAVATVFMVSPADDTVSTESESGGISHTPKKEKPEPQHTKEVKNNTPPVSDEKVDTPRISKEKVCVPHISKEKVDIPHTSPKKIKVSPNSK